jgi:hypothetical protein
LGDRCHEADGGIVTIGSDEYTSVVIQLLAIGIGRIARGKL